MSVAGFYPRGYLTLDQYRPLCDASGTGYHQLDFTSNYIMQLLMIIEMGGMDTQAKIGAGVSNIGSTQWSNYNAYLPMRKAGDTVCAGNRTWDMSTLSQNVRISNTTYLIQSLSYRGIEQPYGHIFKWVDGLVYINNIPETGDPYYTCYAHKSVDGGVAKPAEYVSHADRAAAEADDNFRKLLGLDGQILAVINKSRYWKCASPELMPNDDKSSSAAYCNDLFLRRICGGRGTTCVCGRRSASSVHSVGRFTCLESRLKFSV
jgi:hypothetical protein